MRGTTTCYKCAFAKGGEGRRMICSSLLLNGATVQLVGRREGPSGQACRGLRDHLPSRCLAPLLGAAFHPLKYSWRVDVPFIHDSSKNATAPSMSGHSEMKVRKSVAEVGRGRRREKRVSPEPSLRSSPLKVTTLQGPYAWASLALLLLFLWLSETTTRDDQDHSSYPKFTI